jgi:hypothetical protein
MRRSLGRLRCAPTIAGTQFTCFASTTILALPVQKRKRSWARRRLGRLSYARRQSQLVVLITSTNYQST